jgi:hypothetical protein
LALAFAPHQAAAATACPSLAYISTLGQARGQLDATPADRTGAAATLSGALAAEPGTRPILAPIIADLTASPPDVGDARAQLDPLVAMLQVPAGTACAVDSGAARSTLHDVYSSPVFANLDQIQQPSIFSRIGDFLSSLLAHLLNALGAGGSIAVGLAILGLVLALAAWLLRGMLGSRAAHLRAEPPGDTDDPGLEWRLADRAAARGDYREAIRRAFRSALIEVAVRGRLRVDGAWTTRELLGAANADADLVAALAPAAAGFDRAWYSGEPVDATDGQRARSRCEAIRELARRRPQEAAV